MQYVSIVLGIMQAFFGNNPTVQEIETVLPQLVNAFQSEKNGQGFSISFPVSVGGVKQNLSITAAPVSTTTVN